MNITRYSGVLQSPGRTQTIYTVPDGKIAKIKFDWGLVDGKTANGNYFYYRGNSYYRMIAKNSCYVRSSDCSARIFINDTVILGSHMSSSSHNAFAANMFMDENDNIYTYLDTNFGGADVPYTKSSIKSSADAFGLKNEFILLPGESVRISTNSSSTSYASVNYAFTVYEEDL